MLNIKGASLFILQKNMNMMLPNFWVWKWPSESWEDGWWMLHHDKYQSECL